MRLKPEEQRSERSRHGEQHEQAGDHRKGC
jgi:hypothetical protein